MFSKFLYYSIKDEEAASQLVSRPDSSEVGYIWFGLSDEIAEFLAWI